MTSDTYPKAVSDNGWYELSNGESVRGKEAAEQAQAYLDEHGEDLPEEEWDEVVEAASDDVEPCANCGGPSEFKDNPGNANPIHYCARCRPAYMR